MLFVRDVKEFDLIERLIAVLGPQPTMVGLGTEVTLGVGDDCAATRSTPGTNTLYTTDTMVSGTHFLMEMPPEDLGWKSLASNISDIAGMGGLPTVALVTIAVPPDLRLDWLMGWYRGMAECARTYNVAMSGGDVVRTSADTCITISLCGEVEADRPVTRSGARAGDIIIITGSPGESAAGLALWQAHEQPSNRLLQAHLRPMPRVREARAAIAAGGVTAMMDLSDGVGGDIRHVCRASRVGARIDARAIPIGDDLREAAAQLRRDPLEWMISGGEDYELLLFVEPGSAQTVLAEIQAEAGTPATIIGEAVDPEKGITIRLPSGGDEPLGGGFQHF